MKSALTAAKAPKRKPRIHEASQMADHPATRNPPALRFSPYAWAKLLYLRDLGDTEVGGFAITDGSDLLLVEDVTLVRQYCTPVSVTFDDEAVADFFDRQVDHGRSPEQFARIWLHSHPGGSARPSGTDEKTFQRCFGKADWSVMFILAQGGQTYARLRFNVGPGGAMEIPVDVDFGRSFPAADQSAWEQEYLQAVEVADDLADIFAGHDLPAWDDELVLEDDFDGFQAAWEEYASNDSGSYPRKEDA